MANLGFSSKSWDEKPCNWQTGEGMGYSEKEATRRTIDKVLKQL